MTGPKHLWSGDWEAESEAARRRRRGAEPLPAPPDDDPPPAPPAPRPAPPAAVNGDSPPPVGGESPFIRRQRLAVPGPPAVPGPQPAPRPREPLHIPWRPVGIAVATALIVLGVALGLSALLGGGGGGKPIAKAGWLGVRLGVLPTGAVVVTGIEPGSPARTAGLHTGDVITEVQGRPVAAPVDVALAVDALSAGDELQITALRGSRAYSAQVRLAARPGGAANRAGP